MRQFDIVIVGGGLAGVSLALSLARTDLSIAIIESKPVSQLTTHNSDKRTLVLSIGTMRILENLPIGKSLIDTAYPLTKIHVSEKGSFGKTRFLADDYHVPALGYVTPLSALQTYLYDAVADYDHITWCQDEVIEIAQKSDQTQLALQSDTNLSCSLFIGADGTNSFVRQQLHLPIVEKKSDHKALVCSLEFETKLHHTAFERFYRKTVLAIIPRSDHTAGFVVTGRSDLIDDLNRLTDDDFKATIQSQFGFRAGKLKSIGQRRLFPLQHFAVSQAVKDQAILIGQAAHTFHPIAAQGFNLTLRDIAILAQLIIKANDNDAFFNMNWLQEYEQYRTTDQKRTMQFTHYVTQIFESTKPFSQMGRSVGLLAMDLLSPLKSHLARQAMGLKK